MDSCIFCKIVEGKIPADKVHETGTVLVIEDKFPQAPKHYLLIPKKHVSDLTSLSTEESALVVDMCTAAREVALKKGLDKNGFRLVINQGVNGGQTIFHLHIHMLGGRPMHWPPG